MKKYYYAVKDGKKIGIYNSWPECEIQVKGYRGAVYKKFSTYEEAFEFINGISKDLLEKELIKDKVKVKKPVKIKIQEKNQIKKENQENLMDVADLKEDEAIAYVDGSFDLATFTFSYGVVFLTASDKKEYSGRDDQENLASMRNVSGEIKGAMVAMDIAIKQNKKTLYLHFDYLGIEKWAKGQWKANKEGTKFYKDYYNSIKDKLDVVFIKVKAHSGVKYNEEADKLAKEAIILK